LLLGTESSLSSLDELLKPTLEAGDGQQRAIYSTTAGYMTAFFGGPFAAIALTTLNSMRLKRLAADAWLLLGATLLSVLVTILLYRPQLLGQPDFALSDNMLRLLLRAYALGVFGAGYYVHKRYYRNMEVMGLQPPQAWAAGLGCIVVGVGVVAGLVWSLRA
jgi:hypothetical protein